MIDDEMLVFSIQWEKFNQLLFPEQVDWVWFRTGICFKLHKRMAVFHRDLLGLTIPYINLVKLISAHVFFLFIFVWLLQGESEQRFVRVLIKQAQSISIQFGKTCVIWDCSWDFGQRWWCWDTVKLSLW